jgi:hypothetical protein
LKPALVVALLLAPTLALAHGGLPISQRILRQHDGDVMYVPVVYWGLWVGRPHGPWTWICEEVINDYRFRRFALSTDGTFYATDKQGITRSLDHGCSWTAAPGAIATLRATDVAVDPVDGATAWVATADGGSVTDDGGIVPAHNGVFVTHDHGASWTALAGLESDAARLFTSVRVAPSDAQTIYATSGATLAPFTAMLHRSTDGGDHFTGTTLALMVAGVTPHALELLAVDPRNPLVLWARAIASVDTGSGSEPRHALLRSSDGGVTWANLLETAATTEPSGQSHGIDGVSIDAAGGRVYVATNRGLRAAADDGSSTVPTLAAAGGLSVAQCVDVHGGAVYACSSQYAPDFAAVAQSTDGAQSFSSVLDYAATVGPVDCPAGTPVGDQCPMYWYRYGPQLGVELDGGTGVADMAIGDGGAGGHDDGCGCTLGRGGRATTTATPLSFVLVIGALAAARGRRRRSCLG